MAVFLGRNFSKCLACERNGVMEIDPANISFGFDRSTDEQSLRCFLKQFASEDMLDVIIPRLRDDEILSLVHSISGLMRNHLSEKEYHRLFFNGGQDANL